MQNNQRLTPVQLVAIRKSKGESFAGQVNIRDSETKELLYTNKDVQDIAKFSIKRAGTGYDPNDIEQVSKVNYHWDQLMTDVLCIQCKAINHLYYSTIYKQGGRKKEFYEEGEKPYWRCGVCQGVNEILDIPENKKEYIENKIKEIDFLFK